MKRSITPGVPAGLPPGQPPSGGTNVVPAARLIEINPITSREIMRERNNKADFELRISLLKSRRALDKNPTAIRASMNDSKLLQKIYLTLTDPTIGTYDGAAQVADMLIERFGK